MLCKPQDSHNPWIKLWGRVNVCVCDGSADRPMAWGSLARLEGLVVLGGRA